MGSDRHGDEGHGAQAPDGPSHYRDGSGQGGDCFDCCRDHWACGGDQGLELPRKFGRYPTTEPFGYEYRAYGVGATGQNACA